MTCLNYPILAWQEGGCKFVNFGIFAVNFGIWGCKLWHLSNIFGILATIFGISANLTPVPQNPSVTSFFLTQLNRSLPCTLYTILDGRSKIIPFQ